MTDAILAIDQGTTGTTCLIIDVSGASGAHAPKILARGYREFKQHFPRPSWVEHDLNEIWESVGGATAAALEEADIEPQVIKAIGITNQRETCGLWSEDATPLHHAIVWQDRRTASICESLKQAGHEPRVKKHTGLVLDPYFSGTKLMWLLENVPGLRDKASDGKARFGTIDTWLVYKLTGGEHHITDVTNASRTLLFDIHKLEWDPELCAMLGEVPLSLLPAVRASSEVYGHTKGLDFLPDGIPIAGIAGDQQAALMGQACFEVGAAKCTYGTGAFALVNTGEKALTSEHGLITTVAWKINDTTHYAIEGSVFIAGAVVQWLRDGLQIIENSADVESLARTVESSDGVTVVPALSGLGAPHWRPEATGIITGLTRGSNRGHVARAALEGIAFQIYDLLDAMRKDSGSPMTRLRVDGGAAANDLLMQFQSDLLEVPIDRPTILETTAMGAAYLAGLAVGVFSGLEDVTRAWTLEKTFEAKMSSEQRREHLARWDVAVKKA